MELATVRSRRGRSGSGTYQHSNDGYQEDNLHQAVEDEKQTANHFGGTCRIDPRLDRLGDAG